MAQNYLIWSTIVILNFLIRISQENSTIVTFKNFFIDYQNLHMDSQNYSKSIKVFDYYFIFEMVEWASSSQLIFIFILQLLSI